MFLYVSAEIEASIQPLQAVLRRKDGMPGEVVYPFPRPFKGEAPAIMLELSKEQRIALGLPECGALTGGTALCLAKKEAFDAGKVPLPSAPRNWEELVEAEVWPLGFLQLPGLVDVRPSLTLDS